MRRGADEPAGTGGGALRPRPGKPGKSRRIRWPKARGQAAKPRRLAALEAERETLLARIAELEDELAALSGITEEVEGRLDGAIGEIRAALASA